MAYHFENIRLEKGMYGRSGRSFTQTLEELDPSEHYRGTPLEGLDAFQRQLKRFDIKVKGAGSDLVEKFFHTTDSAVLFPEFVSRVVRQGLEEESILPAHHRHGHQLRRYGLPLHRLRAQRGGQEAAPGGGGRRASRRPPSAPRRTWCACTSGAGCWWPPMRPSGSSGWTCSP